MGPTAQKRRPPPDNFIVEPENFHKLRSWIHTRFNSLSAFLATQPVVTVVGYGVGSTPCTIGNCRGRDYGTTHLFSTQTTSDRWDNCDGTRGPVDTINMLSVKPLKQSNAYTRSGDSGGPLLVGLDTVDPTMEAPTPIPASSGLAQGRYVVGVDSYAWDSPLPGTSCSAAVPCSVVGDICDINPTTGNGTCLTPCTTDADCPANGACVVNFCKAPRGAFATTYEHGNGLWLMKAINDIDEDGVTNAFDNCLGVKNTEQANCNRDAELDRQGDVLGDACDPVPCPEATAPVVFEVPISHASSSCESFSEIRQVRDTIDPNVLGSHNPFSGAVMEDPQKRASFRFCVRNDNLFINCLTQSGQRRDDGFDLNESQTEWRNVSLPSLGPSGATTTWDFPSDPAPLRWDYWTDRAAWVAAGWLVSANPQKPLHTFDQFWTRSSDIQGAFGLRAGLEQSHDMLGTINHNANGIHFTPDLNDGYAMGEGLARAYIDMQPDAIAFRFSGVCVETTCAGVLCGHGIPPLLPLRWCIDCDRPTVWSEPDLPPIDALLATTIDGDFGLVDEKGRVVVIENLLSPMLTSNLSNPEMVLASVAEPNLSVGRGYRDVQGVFLSADGTTTHGNVVSGADGFRMEREGIIDSNAVATFNVSTNAMAPRHDFAAVLSRTLGVLVVVGGTDAATGESRRDIWLKPEYVQPSELVVPGYQPERVLAVTVAPADGSLWILDEQSPGSARLVRIDPVSTQFEMVWSGARTGRFDRYWLGADHDGKVLLYGSSSGSHKHVIVRFEMVPFALGTAHAVLARFDQGTLLGAPLVDAMGYQVITVKGRNRLRAKRIQSLDDAPPGHVVDLSECM